MVGPSRRRYICHGLIVAATLATKAAFGANPDNGERLAHRWCEACHVVVVSASQRRSTTDQAPPFASIAKTPDFDAAKIALFLRSASEDAGYGPISHGSGGSCGLYCNAQIVPVASSSASVQDQFRRKIAEISKVF